MAHERIQKRSPSLSHALHREIARLFWIASAVCLLLSLLSYSPSDASWSTWSSKLEFHNWMGRFGSIVADCLIQLMGLGSFALAFLLGAHPFREKLGEDSNTEIIGFWNRALTPLFFLFALSALIQVWFPTTWTPWHLINPGGLVGNAIEILLLYSTGSLGARFLSLCLFMASLIVLFRWHIISVAERLARQYVPQLLNLVKQSPARLLSRVMGLVRPDATSVQASPAEPSFAVPAHPKLAELTPILPGKDPGEEGRLPSSILGTGGRSEDAEELFRMVAPRQRSVTSKKNEVKPKTSRANLGDYELPSLSLLSGKAESKTKAVDKNWYLEKGNILVQKLKDFGVDGEIVHISPGPVITVYEFKPASGVKIKEIANLSDDLTLALSVLSVRIVAPIPGKPVVGIEIPSPHREVVFFKDMVEETPFYTGDIRIPIVLGRLASGEPVVAGLATMPHLLVAGSTGTGKSVFINTLICSLLYRYTPQQLKLILVDPKMVELSSYEGVPHLLLPVVVDSKKAAAALRWTVDEMERRYTLMHQMGVRHLDAYNEKVTEAKLSAPIRAKEDSDTPLEEPCELPYIVVVIDEYADLMAVVPKDVELSIARLAQKARASGIHLVLATQRPSTDVVTGTIKANFPSRISFRVASSVDSKTILDRTGADRLLGNGDMLFHSAGFTTLKRIQGAFISDANLEKVVEHLKAQGEPEYDERILATQTGDEEGESENGDHSEGDLYDRAVRLVSEKGEASISLIQRHLKIGYNRAASLMEQMEKEGVVAQSTGAAKRRAVLVNNI